MPDMDDFFSDYLIWSASGLKGRAQGAESASCEDGGTRK